jgi:hypothetical protein
VLGHASVRIQTAAALAVDGEETVDVALVVDLQDGFEWSSLSGDLHEVGVEVHGFDAGPCRTETIGAFWVVPASDVIEATFVSNKHDSHTSSVRPWDAVRSRVGVASRFGAATPPCTQCSNACAWY